jgi:hypothetical protein
VEKGKRSKGEGLKMKRIKLNALLLIGIIGTFTVGTTFATNVYRAFWGNRNIYWTARTMPLTIGETKNSFEMFIHRKSIHDHLTEGTLQVVLENGDQKPIAPSDIAVRINNWDKVKSSILAQSLIPSILFGASCTMLIIGVIQILRRTNRNPQ